MILALFISFVAFKKHYGNIISYALVEKKRVGLYYSGFWVILLFGKFDNYVVTSTYNFALFKNIYFLSRIAKVGLNIAVNPELTVEKGHQIANEVRHQLLHHLRYLSNATIHIDPINISGEEYHHIAKHKHDNLPYHSH